MTVVPSSWRTFTANGPVLSGVARTSTGPDCEGLHEYQTVLEICAGLKLPSLGSKVAPSVVPRVRTSAPFRTMAASRRSFTGANPDPSDSLNKPNPESTL